MEHRDVLFTGHFKRIIICLPTGTLYQHQDYLDQMKKVCPHIEIFEGVPDVAKIGLTNDPETSKLLVSYHQYVF